MYSSKFSLDSKSHVPFFLMNVIVKFILKMFVWCNLNSDQRTSFPSTLASENFGRNQSFQMQLIQFYIEKI